MSLLKVWLIVFYFWADIIFNFVIGLQVNKYYNIILIVINYITKKKILCIIYYK